MMRVTNNNRYTVLTRNLEEIQKRKFEEEIRITTGKQIINLSDAPNQLSNVKRLTSVIERKEQFQENINRALSEISVVGDKLNAISDRFILVRQTALEASSTGNNSNLPTIGVYMRGILEDIIKDANTDFNGQYTFAGTKNTPASISVDDPNDEPFPFLIIEGDATEDNPSGLRVEFRGNFKEREINKDEYSTEVINTRADQVFGEGGTEVFGAIIDIYNVFTYRSDGTKRESGDLFTTEELKLVDKYQKKVAQVYEDLINVNSQQGTVMTRLESVHIQYSEELTRLRELRSLDSDTDVSKATVKLMQEETALQYALQVGGRMMPQTLFDFLSI